MAAGVLTNDTDVDGLDDSYDTDNGGSPIVIVNSDSVDQPDYLDDDSDGDGIADALDSGSNGNPDLAPDDSDEDGVCEGVDTWKPTFLIFRFRTAWDQEKIAAFVAGMNSFPDINCGAGIGNGGMYRVGITTALWYQKDRNLFVQWWQELPQKMQTVLTVIHCLSS